MKLNGYYRWNGQKGQALTEFIVISVVLIALFLLMPMVGKYQDMAFKTQMASRYAAFDAINRNDQSASGWNPEASLANDIRRRFFSNAGAPIRTNDVADNTRENQNDFWRDPVDNPLIADFNSDVNVSYGPSNGSHHADGFTTSADGSSMLLHDQLGLAAKGIYGANVGIKLAHLPDNVSFYKPFDTLDLNMYSSTSILIDGWAAKDTEQVRQKIMNAPLIFPSEKLAVATTYVGAGAIAADALAVQAPPRLGQLDFWNDVVPDDRLKSGN